MSTSVSKIVAERNHRALLELVLKPGNDICADCKARAPRWASYNLGIFICVSCASIHRKIGTHITKVKSITLDEWTKEQVEVMKEKGNVKSNALYNPEEARHPPPTNMTESERDSELERFIRSKYEFKRFMNRKSGPTSQRLTADSPKSAPLMDSPRIDRKASPGPPLPPKTPENLPSSLRLLATVPSHSLPPTRSFSQPLPPSDKLISAPPLKQLAATLPSAQKPAGKVWEDLISLQEPSQSSSLPLQYNPPSPIAPFPSQLQVAVHQQPIVLTNSPNPFINLSLGQVNATTPLVASPMSISVPVTQLSFVPSAPLSSPALHLGATNPFNQGPLPASRTGTAFSTGLNPFSSPTATSTPATSSMQPAMALPAGSQLHTPPFSYVTPQTSAPALVPPFTPFTPRPMAGPVAQNLSALVGAQGQMPLSANGVANPFSAMHMSQTESSGGTPHTGYETAAFWNQQQGPNGFTGWASHSA